jgi:hypothetical protein
MTDETIAATQPTPPMSFAAQWIIIGAAVAGIAFGSIVTSAITTHSDLYVDRIYDQCEREFSAYADGAIGKCYVNSTMRYIAERLEKSREKLNSAYQRAR